MRGESRYQPASLVRKAVGRDNRGQGGVSPLIRPVARATFSLKGTRNLRSIRYRYSVARRRDVPGGRVIGVNDDLACVSKPV